MRKKSFLFILLCWLLAAGGAGYLLFSKQDADGVMLDVSTQTPQEEETDPLTSLPAEEEPVSATTTLEGARFTGKTAAGDQWNISAQKAQTEGVQDGSSAQTKIQLEKLNATLMAKTGKNIHFTALHGAYQTQEETLTLNQKVTVTAKGLTLTTEELIASLHTQTMQSSTPTRLFGTLGTWDAMLEGNTLNASFTGSDPTISMVGNVHAILTPHPTNAQEKD